MHCVYTWSELDAPKWFSHLVCLLMRRKRDGKKFSFAEPWKRQNSVWSKYTWSSYRNQRRLTLNLDDASTISRADFVPMRISSSYLPEWSTEDGPVFNVRWPTKIMANNTIIWGAGILNINLWLTRSARVRGGGERSLLFQSLRGNKNFKQREWITQIQNYYLDQRAKKF